MSNLEQYIPFVKHQIAFHQSRMGRFSSIGKYPNETRMGLHESSANTFTLLQKSIEDAIREICELKTKSQTPSVDASKISLQVSFSDLEGLPEELLSELSVGSADKAEMAIYSSIESNGGVASLDQILIALWRATNEIPKRDKVNQKIYRMVQKESLYSVPFKKGVYSIRPLSNLDIEQFIGGGNTSEGKVEDANDLA